MAHRTTLEAERPAKSAKAPKKSSGRNEERERIFDACRRWGYNEANLDPLGFFGPFPQPELEGLTGEAAETARRIYCGTIGAEFMHLPQLERRGWIAERIEGPATPVDQQKVLERLIRADLFEQVLQSRYLGTKRFSLEGVTALIPLLDSILDNVAEHGAVESVMAMSHRGRLNVMVHAACKSPHEVVAGFEDIDPRSVLGAGDVKYHVGATGTYVTSAGKEVGIHLVSNPSHLEAVDPVAMGRARAKQTRYGSGSAAKVVPIVMHGDAAFAGQGIWAETLNLADLQAYTVGGTIHIIVNNLIGFTTRPEQEQSSRFASDIAKRQYVPVFHVNGEDPDAVVRVGKLAADYRAEFGSDVVVDIIGYRRHGHSEVDDPTITQPRVYDLIKNHPPLWRIYAERIGVQPMQIVENVRKEYEEEQSKAREIKKIPHLRQLPKYWSAYRRGRFKPEYEADTGLDREKLAEITDALVRVPDGFHVHPNDVRPVSAASCTGLDFATSRSDAEVREYVQSFVRDRLGNVAMHPDAWGPVLVRNVAEAPDRLAEVAGDLYTYRQLDDFSHEIERSLQSVLSSPAERTPIVAKVTRSGVLPERIFVDYSQQRLAEAAIPPSQLASALAARNTTMPGGSFDSGDRHVVVDPNVRDRSFRDMDDVMIASSSSGTPVRLRDLASLSRGYESPARFLNYLVTRDPEGHWQRNRAVTIAISMRSGQQIGQFGAAVDEALRKLRPKFPPDLVIARTSDQPRQVKENIDLFMVSLYEAIVLVVFVSLIGFWSWRTALLVATSIPLTIAMSFGAMLFLGVDLQQVSIATLIIALGLLVDMPVVAGDAIQRELAEGTPRRIATWIGPTRLVRAIVFATLTNIVAYLPFLALSGDTGRFLHSLPIVMTVNLVAALIITFTFIPLIAFGIAKAPKKAEPSIEERRRSGFTGWYARTMTAALRYRHAVLAGSLLILVAGGFVFSRLKSGFFPTDLQYLSYVDVWVPEDAPLSVTNAAAAEAERVIREQAEEFGKHHGHKDVLKTLTTFVGGAGPRFWFSIEPEQQQLNYAQILIEVTDKHFSKELVAPIQAAVSRIPGARIDVRQLETGKPVGIPVSIRVSGEDIATLRKYAGEVAEALRSAPASARVRDNWGPPGLHTHLAIDDDRASLSGVTRFDVAISAAAAVSGIPVGQFREGDRLIPIVARLRVEDRARLSDLSSMYAFSSASAHSVPIRQVAHLEREFKPSKMFRRNQIRTITVSAYPIPGYQPSEVVAAAMPSIGAIKAQLPPGYRIDIGGEHDEQQKGFGELGILMAASCALIYLALLFQFDNAVKPLLVFAAIPYGVVGAVLMLAIMGQTFGFMAFLGIASLVGVIVSHVIVLFDFIEEAHHRGESLENSLIDAGIVRLRPVMITVGATVLGLIPLAAHGGPLWEPLCYAQIGGLTIATFITLGLVPLIYTVFVRDLKIVKWEHEAPAANGGVHGEEEAPAVNGSAPVLSP